MNSDMLSQNFATFTEAPGGIDALRQLILQLAVRGKLVPQNPDDEAVSVLLEKIAEEKKRLKKEGKLKRQKKLPPIDEDEVPYEIPQSWEWTRLGSIVYCRDWERVPLSKENRKNRSGKYDYYGASGVIDKIDDFLFDKPLLLIGEDGANLVRRSTPIAFIAKGKYWVNNHAHVLDDLDMGYLRYLEIFINATDLKPYVSGSAQPKMNQAKMNSIPISFPPLAEQHRIVSKVDQLMDLCDELERKQQKRSEVHIRMNNGALTKLQQPSNEAEFNRIWAYIRDNFDILYTKQETVKKLREAVLQLAVQGRLVEQDPNDEPASVLLERIKKEMDE